MKNFEKLCILGKSSRLYGELVKLGLEVSAYGRGTTPSFDLSKTKNELLKTIPVGYKYYCINVGYMSGMHILDMTQEEAQYSIQVNLIGIIEAIEYLLIRNKSCRILVIGSESGEKGSYDTVYFVAKAALRQYVLERKVLPNQQLLMISPSTILDGGMTVRRSDVDRLDTYANEHPKKRFMKMEELAMFIKDIFMRDHIYLCNEEVRLNGGKFARMKYDYPHHDFNNYIDKE
jgi:hypothetical protein